MKAPFRKLIAIVVFAVAAGCVWGAVQLLSARGLPIYENQTLYQWTARFQIASTNYIDQNRWKEVEASKKAIQSIGAKALPYAMADAEAGLTTVEKGRQWLAAHAKWLTIKPHDFTTQRARGICMLQALGPIADPCLPQLVADARKGSGYSGYTEDALMAIGPAALPAFTNIIATSVFPQTGNLISALANSVYAGRISPEAAGVTVPYLARVFVSPDSYGRWQAANAFAAIHQQPEICVPLLAQGLADKSESIRASSIRSLGAFGESASICADKIAAAMDSPDSSVRLAACDALGKFRTHGEVTVPALVRGLQDTDESIRNFAAMSLGQAHSIPILAVPALTNALHDPSATVRILSAQSLGQFRGSASNAIPALRECLRDARASNAAVSHAAETAIHFIQGKINP